jgi:hypothetical protein
MKLPRRQFLHVAAGAAAVRCIVQRLVGDRLERSTPAISDTNVARICSHIAPKSQAYGDTRTPPRCFH